MVSGQRIPGFFALFFLAVGAQAQIRFVAGPQRLVSQAPTFIAAGYFNGDQFQDVAVTNPTGGRITVLDGVANGNALGHATDVDVGRPLHGLAAGDLNSDGIPDLAVADFLGNKVFVVLGAADNTFKPVSYAAGLHPVDVAIGNFDQQKGSDLVIVDQGTNTARVLFNLGGEKGFSTQSVLEIDLGARPQRVVAADLNHDDFDDLIVLTTDGTATDAVAVVLNDARGGFAAVTRFPVGEGAVDGAVADFNDDGVPDLAVLDAGTFAAQTSYSVSILINQAVTTPAGAKVGSGTFIGQTPLTVRCPATLGGIPIYCHPNSLAAADFDSDGLSDLAITVSTQTQSGVGVTTTSGLLQGFTGRGSSTFDFSSQILVGNNPQGIVAADFNGDGLDDVAIAEAGTSSVRIINALIGGGCHQPNCPCYVGRQCNSGACVDGVCCGSPSCPTGQFCNIAGSLGTCALPLAIYRRCTDGHDCATGFCVDGFCCNTGVCPAGEFCNNPEGTCQPPAQDGNKCNNANDAGGDNQCASTHCTDGTCCTVDRCPACSACNISGSEGVCTAELPVGSRCTDTSQCAQPTPGRCDSAGFCQQGVCCDSGCIDDESCALPGTEGFCTKLSLPTGTPPPSTPTRTPTPREPLGTCTIDSECLSGHCVDLVCCATVACPTNEFCNLSTSPGVCATQGPPGAECHLDSDCQSGNCDRGSGSCQGTHTPTPTQSTVLPTSARPTLTPGRGSSSTVEGCAIDTRANRSTAWLLLIVPLLFGAWSALGRALTNCRTP